MPVRGHSSIPLPFLTLVAPVAATVHVAVEAADRSRVRVRVDAPLAVWDHKEVLRAMGLQQLAEADLRRCVPPVLHRYVLPSLVGAAARADMLEEERRRCLELTCPWQRGKPSGPSGQPSETGRSPLRGCVPQAAGAVAHLPTWQGLLQPEQRPGVSCAAAEKEDSGSGAPLAPAATDACGGGAGGVDNIGSADLPASAAVGEALRAAALMSPAAAANLGDVLPPGRAVLVPGVPGVHDRMLVARLLQATLQASGSGLVDQHGDPVPAEQWAPIALWATGAGA